MMWARCGSLIDTRCGAIVVPGVQHMGRKTDKHSADVLEASYRLELSDSAWIQNLLIQAHAARPMAAVEEVAAAFLFQCSPNGEKLRTWGYTATGGRSDVLRALQARHAALSPNHARTLFWDQKVVCLTQSQRGLPATEQQQSIAVADFLGLQATDVSGLGCSMFFVLPERTTIHPAARKQWRAVAMHLQAALRLRRALTTADLDACIEAVIDPARQGRPLVHADGPARTRNARAALRRIALAIDQARTHRRRRDSCTTLKVWPELIRGRWTLVEHFDSDGRRYYVALRNPPALAAGLSGHEINVIVRIAAGEANKAVADNPSTVNQHYRRAMAKLRISSRSELPVLAGDLQQVRVTIDDTELLIMTPCDVPEHLGLTRTEVKVVQAIRRGLSNREIARLQGSSESTIANHIQAIHHRLQVNSRTEMLARICNARPAA